ncbi:MAG: histidine kinase [Chitinophagaceae bacterium]
MNQNIFIKLIVAAIFSLPGYFNGTAHGQVSDSKKFKKASRKIESGFEKNNIDTLAQGFYDLGETYYQQGELVKSESYYQRSKIAFEKMENAEGIAKSSRALAKVQEALQKNKEAIINYKISEENTWATGDSNSNRLNRNDIGRLLKPDSFLVQEKLIQDNIDIGLKNKDTNEVVVNYSRMAELNLRKQNLPTAITAFGKAYSFSKQNPGQALYYNGIITDIYLKNKKFDKAIEAKKQIISEPFVQNSSQLKASEITSLADIYIQKKENLTAIGLLNESYALSVKNGHTLEAKKCIEKLDSIFQSSGKKEMSLKLYKTFLAQLPNIISKDSSLTDTKFIAETEEKLKKLETEKALKDDLLRKKNIFTYWLIGSIIILSIFAGIILFILNKLKIRNKKIALQSLRREMNPHFIFNSLNSINQFIANNNELEANQYLTKFSTLMRRVMENSKEDFVLFSKEVELLQNYLELEKSRFTDKFDFEVKIDDTLYAEEQLYIPGMLIQPHLENAIWHGLRYINNKGFLKLHFTKKEESIIITIEDNGIGIAESKNIKSANQQKQSGRGISNTMERIKILNELYHQRIICLVEDKIAPDHGVIVHISVPILKSIQHDH